MRKKPVRIVRPAEYEIPASFVREVGRIIVRWAYFENAVSRLVWDAMGVDPKMGRVAVQDPRMEDKIAMISEIAYLRKLTIDQAKLDDLIKKAKETDPWRNLVGLWIPNDGGWLLQKIGGQYSKDYEAEHRKRRINPEGINVDLEGLRSISEGIKFLINETLTLRAELQDQLKPSPDTSRDPAVN